MAMSLRELADRIGATIVGNGDVIVRGCAPIDSAGPDEVTFLANRRYARYLETTKAAGILIHDATPCPDRLTRLECADPYFAFRGALIELYGFRPHPLPIDAGGDPARAAIKAGSEHVTPGVSPRAVIHSTARIGEGSIVHPFAIVEHDATVGRDCVLYPGTYIGPFVEIGDGCILHPQVTIYDRCTLGNRVTVHAGTVIGQDGFGYATHDGRHEKIPQTGTVEIEDDVEIGAVCAVERATIGTTRIGKGTKFADLVGIGHGTTVGAHCLFVSLVGVAGSVDVGDYVVLGGQVGVAGHVTIGAGVQAMGRTGIARSIPPGLQVGGTPPVEAKRAKRNALVAADLYGLLERVRHLERELGKRPEIEAAARPKPDVT